MIACRTGSVTRNGCRRVIGHTVAIIFTIHGDEMTVDRTFYPFDPHPRLSSGREVSGPFSTTFHPHPPGGQTIKREGRTHAIWSFSRNNSSITNLSLSKVFCFWQISPISVFRRAVPPDLLLEPLHSRAALGTISPGNSFHSLILRREIVSERGIFS